jgi:ketosteroid isomerase-like protein
VIDESHRAKRLPPLNRRETPSSSPTLARGEILGSRMAQENAEIVRRPLSPYARSWRALDQRMGLRFPRLAAAVSRRIGKQPPSSRIRQAVLARSVRLALAAYNKRDLEAVVVGWDPQCEYRPGEEWVKAGLAEASYRGFEGYRRYVAATAEVWGDENYLRPVELIDLGDRVVILAEGEMRAQASGVPLSQSFALVTTLRDGMPISHQEYYDHAEALAAVGLRD